MNALRKYFSPDAIRRSVADVMARFPFTVGYLLLLSAWLIAMVWKSFDLPVRVIESVTWPLCEGCLLSLAAQLWCEYLRKESRCIAVQLAILALVVVDGVVLAFRGGVSDAGEYLGRSAIVTALLTAIVFLPSAPDLNRRQLWYYTLCQIGAAASGIALAAVLSIAILLIFGTLGALFGFDSWKLMYTFEILFCVLLPAVFYLSRIPEREYIAAVRELDSTAIVGACCKNVLLPLVAVYTLILYVYGAKILFTWSLPKDSLSVMVTGLMCVSLVMLYGLQRYTFGDDAKDSARKIALLVRSILPALLLPLVVLMSVGVIYRVGEYGLTASRLYVITFNIWAYGVLAFLLLKKDANLNIVAGTFAVVFVLVSIVPGLNLTAIATRSVRGEVMRTLREAGVEKFPISDERLLEIIEELPQQTGRNLASRLEYLDDWEDHSRVADIVKSDERLATWRLVKDDCDEVEVTAVELPSREYAGEVEVPEGFSSVKYRQSFELDTKVNVDSIYAADNAVMAPVFVSVNDSTVFAITWIYRYSSDGPSKTRISGYEFKK